MLNKRPLEPSGAVAACKAWYTRSPPPPAAQRSAGVGITSSPPRMLEPRPPFRLSPVLPHSHAPPLPCGMNALALPRARARGGLAERHRAQGEARALAARRRQHAFASDSGRAFAPSRSVSAAVAVTPAGLSSTDLEVDDAHLPGEAAADSVEEVVNINVSQVDPFVSLGLDERLTVSSEPTHRDSVANGKGRHRHLHAVHLLRARRVCHR